MNIGEIAEVFIRAAEVDRNTGGHVGPAEPHSVSLPYVHDYVDKLNWRKEPGRRVVKKGKLIRGDWLEEDPLAEERKRFWEELGMQPSAHELSELEVVYDWLMSAGGDADRRALLAWARAKAGGRPFSRWCKQVERIHPETGRQRKNRALSCIASALARKPMQNNENGQNDDLLVGPDFGDIPATIATDAGDREKRDNWMATDGFAPIMPAEANDFSWANKRNELRRQREARKRKERDAKRAA